MDVVVLNYNDAVTTMQFVESIKYYSCVRKIVVVDNCSTDDSFNKVSQLASDNVSVIRTESNGGYGYGNNWGIRYLYDNCKSEYILLSNPDVIVQENVLVKLEEFLRCNRDYTIAAPFMLNAKGEKVDNTAFRLPTKKEYILHINWLLKHFFVDFNYKNLKDDLSSAKDVDAVAGSMFLMNAEDMMKYGMFDENMFLYCEEVVLGLKLKKNNKKAALLTNLSFVHNHSVSINKTYSSAIAKQKIYIKSKLYVIKQYYRANFWELLVAYFLSKISLIDVVAVPYLRNTLQKIKFCFLRKC